MNMDEIKDLVLHYLLCYHGCQTRAIKRICVDLCDRNYSEFDCRYDVIQAFKDLEQEGKIIYIPVNEMNELERRYFESDSSPIYRIVN